MDRDQHARTGPRSVGPPVQLGCDKTHHHALLSVNELTAARADMGELLADGAAGFDEGRWPVRLLADRAGFCLPPLARCGPSRGFPCQIPTRPWNFPVECGSKVSRLSRQPTGAGPAVAGAKARAPWRRPNGPAGRLDADRRQPESQGDSGPARSCHHHRDDGYLTGTSSPMRKTSAAGLSMRSSRCL